MLAEYTSHVNMDMECTILFHFPSKRFYQKKKKKSSEGFEEDFLLWDGMKVQNRREYLQCCDLKF